MDYLSEYAKPFYFEGNQTACLLIHGFTGSPAHMRLLGEALHQEGYTVKGILLPGHGTSMEDMEQTDWQDWLAAVEEEYQKLRAEYSKVYLLGLSMGGILSLLLAQNYAVDKVVSIAAPIKIYNKLAYLTPVLKYLKRFNYSSGGEKLEYETYDVGYSATPVRTVPCLLKLMKLAKNNLEQVECPTLIIQSHQDQTVKPVSAEMIYNQVASQEKDILWLEESGHVVTLGPEKELVHQRIIEFLQD
ncbi:alpha/beta fold hydrolase [Natroniella sulfidigena]|uniref:alpha/beta hydrolase n=1 Tax=Natroniella sulfidigena TaxID=723921 RepID=UPI00200AF2FE|nr:alpha/beta fold hydrolase [Natroniella sulfidigena]MCK8817981.1 alpha/beta fold hydrolase [Natroniella sulfidigena]